MTANELREKYLKFFEDKGHKIIPSAPLVPENDPTALFNSAGMQPLVPYLLGQPHPEGKRLVDVQKCVRTGDIDEVGDTTHHTFFEMLGNWSLNDYFKKEAIEWSYEFLTNPDHLNIPKEKLAVSVFAGDKDAPFDQESYDVWISLGIPPERIAKLPKSDNWWGPVGDSGPCGPNSEMFVWVGEEPTPGKFDPEDKRWVEVWNDVFMHYNKTKAGKYELLPQKNVDTGMGMERTLSVLNDLDDDYQTELFWPVIEKIETLTEKGYEEHKGDFRVIADHIKAAVFIASDGIKPLNVGQGYVLRRLIRRAVRKGKLLKIHHLFLSLVAEVIINIYSETYPKLKEQQKSILSVLTEEEERFQKPINQLEQYREDLQQAIKYHTNKKIKDAYILSTPDTASGEYVYEVYQSYGLPPDLAKEAAEELGLKFDQQGYNKAFKRHQELSRTASAGMFRGGLQDQSETTTKYHTATHLLHAALRQILGSHVQQRGSNITTERLRFDFSHPEQLTEEQIKEVEDIVNQKIKEDLPISSETMNKDAALKLGALGFFVEKYGDQVTVYSIGNFSKEICGGPHVENIKQLGKFKIIKEESAGSGVRRIYATLS